MGEVKLYYVGDNGLVEGEQLGRLGVYLAADYDALLSELHDALDVKKGCGPTALSAAIADRDALRAENAELVAALEFVGAKVKSSGRCHPGAVQYLLAEGLEAVDAAIAKHRGE